MARDKVQINPEIEAFTEKLAQNPTSRIFAPLADAYRKSGMIDEAIEVCQKGLNLHPNYMSAHVVLGKAFLQKDMLHEAQTEFEKVLVIDPENLVALTMLGEVLHKLELYDEATKKYEKILKLDPFNDNAKKTIEILRLQKETAFEKQPEVYNVYQEEAEKDKEKNKHLHEISQTQKLKKVSFEDDDINTLTMAKLYFRQGMLHEASRVCKKILNREPSNVEVKNLLQEIILNENPSIKIDTKEKTIEISDKKIIKEENIIVDKIKIEPKVEAKKEVAIEIKKEIKPEPKIENPKKEIQKVNILEKEVSFADIFEEVKVVKENILQPPKQEKIEIKKEIQIKKEVSKKQPSPHPLEDWLDLIIEQDNKS